ncbi:hypothetical protein FGD71_026430 [Streptomyces sporangiiformans]|uniref:Uncharacterized protein n=1 Tax=Streptomyces sporangiiformans TaxID=2315329 RepID=A0A505DFF0_9ACTN|nr:hypothetical protein FGD71_026430 [Streptomyces sporangiiformans]
MAIRWLPPESRGWSVAVVVVVAVVVLVVVVVVAAVVVVAGVVVVVVVIGSVIGWRAGPRPAARRPGTRPCRPVPPGRRTAPSGR